MQDPNSDAARAMNKLAALLSDQHSDPWMKDFLGALRPEQREAVRALSEAITANVQGFPDTAAEKAASAAQIFSQQHNTPGELRAGLEAVYAEQRKLKGQKCISRAEELRGTLAGTKYRWAKGQLALEDAVCSNLKTRLDAVAETLDASRRIASEFRYPVLGLRTVALDASFRRQRHDYQGSWQELKEGLGLYYQGVYPEERLYNFYSIIEQYLEDTSLPNAQRAILLQAIKIRENDSPKDANLILTGMQYLHLANSFAGSGQDAQAQAATLKANALMERAPSGPTVSRYVLYAKIDAAERQLRAGDPHHLALTILEPSRKLLPEVEHDFMFLDFSRVLGEGYRYAGRLGEAERAFEDGIVTAERALNSLDSETGRLEWVNGAGRLYRDLVLNLLDQHKEHEALQVWEWFRDRSLKDERSARPHSWADLQGEIFKPLPLTTEPHLIYAVLADRLQVWVAGDKNLTAKSVPINQHELESLVTEFAKECANPVSDLDELNRHSVKLGKIFLEPVSADLAPFKSITIELDPKISRLPIAALMMSGNIFLDDQHPFTISPGLWMEGNLRPTRIFRQNELILMVDASPTSGPYHLPGHELLTKSIAEIFPRTNIAQPVNATWKTVVRQFAQSDILVFFGHGIHASTGTALSYGAARLTAKDFSPELLNHLDLAVLIACSSGVSGENGLLEPDNLVRVFFAAGVPNVIASRWDVDSRMSARLMEEFHRRLGRSEDVADALSQARKQVRREKPHPYYWAAFDIDGRAN